MPFLVGARSSARDAWAFPDFPGQPERGQFTLPEVAGGRVDLRDYAAEGLTEELPFMPRYRQSGRGQRAGDMLWTGSSAKLASARFIAVLEEMSATGYRTAPARVLSRNGDVWAYSILAVDDGDDSKDLSWAGDGQASHFIASDRLVAALRSAGVTDFECEPWEGLDVP